MKKTKSNYLEIEKRHLIKKGISESDLIVVIENDYKRVAVRPILDDKCVKYELKNEKIVELDVYERVK